MDFKALPRQYEYPGLEQTAASSNNKCNGVGGSHLYEGLLFSVLLV